MRKPRRQWPFHCVVCLLILQVAWQPAAGGQQPISGSQAAASRVWQQQHQAAWPQSPVFAASSAHSRLLLQTEQQQPEPEEQVVEAAQNEISAVSLSDSQLAQDEARLQDTEVAEVASQTAEQLNVHQYQPGTSPAIDKQKLIDAAATQASQHLSALPGASDISLQTRDLDTWPLVNPPFQPALHECFGSSKLHRVCKYYNLLLWNGTLYYPTTDAATLSEGPPRVPISWVALDLFSKMEFGQNEWAEAVLPSDLPFDWATTPKLSMKEALFWKLTFQDNYGHLLGEHGPIIHNLMCSYLNRCSYTDQDLEDFHLLLGNSREDELSVMPTAGQEMFRCFCKRALMLTNDIFFKDHVVVIGTLLAGIGPTCRGYPWCRPQFGRSPMVSNMVTTWQNRMLDCVGLPKDVVAPAETINLAIIDRSYSAGRAFLNLPDLTGFVQDQFPGQLNITVDRLEGKSLRQQAALYNNASIVIQTHGAALGNIIFLPRGAVVIDVVPENNEDKSPWVVYMCADFKPLFISPITIPPQKTVLQMDKVSRTKEWAQLTPYWKQRILQEGKCPQDKDVDMQMDTYAACNFQWFLKSGNLVLDLQQVSDGLRTGITHVRGVHERMFDYVHKSYEFDLTAAVV